MEMLDFRLLVAKGRVYIRYHTILYIYVYLYTCTPCRGGSYYVAAFFSRYDTMRYDTIRCDAMRCDGSGLGLVSPGVFVLANGERASIDQASELVMMMMILLFPSSLFFHLSVNGWGRMSRHVTCTYLQEPYRYYGVSRVSFVHRYLSAFAHNGRKGKDKDKRQKQKQRRRLKGTELYTCNYLVCLDQD